MEAATTWPADAATLSALRGQGMTSQEIADRFGVTLRSVENRIRKLKLGKPRKAPADRPDRVRELHAKGLMDAAIAFELGCTRQTVTNVRNSLGLSPNGKPDQNALIDAGTTWPPAREVLDRLLNEDRVSLTALAEHFGVTRYIVTEHAVSLGLRNPANDPRVINRQKQRAAALAAKKGRAIEERLCSCCRKPFEPATRWIFTCTPCKSGELYRASI